MGAIKFTMLLFIIAGLIIAISLVVMYVISRQQKNNNPDTQKTSADWINVRDITDNEILTTDGMAISLFRIKPINTHLMTTAEKKSYIAKVSGYLSTIQIPYKLLSVPRPFDVQPYVERLEAQKENATDKQRFIIHNEISSLNEIAKSGTIIEKIHYIVFWDKPEDIAKSRNDFIKSWTDAGIQTTLLNQKELISLCNLIFNPSYTNSEEDIDTTFPMLEV